MKRTVALALALLVVAAGCAEVPVGPSPATPTATPPLSTTPPTATASPTPEPTATPTPTATPVPTPTDIPSADNPWGRRVVTVRVNNSTAPERNWRALAAEALAYWNDEAGRHTDYEVVFRFVGTVDRVERPDADVEVRVRSGIDTCGTSNVTYIVGCAPYPGADGRHGPGTEVAQVVDGLADNTTVQVMKHEFGHLLDLRHGDEPMPLMANRTVTTERYRVHLDLSGVQELERHDYREQVEHALDYYAAGAEGFLPGGARFVFVEEPTEADVVVSFPSEARCLDETEDGSCGGTDDSIAGDPYHIEVAGIDADGAGWHVGYWLAGPTAVTDFPPPFRNPGEVSYEERRERWWREDE